MSILIAGDIHGEYGVLNDLVNKKHPQAILQCGDFGYWPRLDWEQQLAYEKKYHGQFKARVRMPRAKDTEVYFCDGNHEDHESLITRDDDELFPNVWYMPRGSTLMLPDGRIALFIGGAKSVDKDSRTQGYDWFPEEEISYGDILPIIEELPPVDIVISHTCPKEFSIRKRNSAKWGYVNDGSRGMLSHVLQQLRPSLWYFGHWHTYQTGFTMGCRWTALDHSPYKWWERLRD